MDDKRKIRINLFHTNILLCLLIVLLWAIALALRNTAQEFSDELAATQPPAPAAPQLPAETPRQDEEDDEITALQDEAAELRQDIHSLRQESEEELTAYAKQWEQRLQQPKNELEPEEWFARLTSPDATEEQKQYYARRQEWVRKNARKRIQNRQLILSHLENADITSEQLAQIREWFAQLDEFDAAADYRFYYHDMRSLVLAEKPDRQKRKLQSELIQLIRSTLTDDAVRRNSAVENAFYQTVPGHFFFTSEDIRKLSPNNH